MTRIFLLALVVSFTGLKVGADDNALPDPGFPANRYEALWTKSPFSVAAAEANSQGSSDYTLKGIVQLGGTSYASLVDNQSQNPFLVTTDGKSVHGLTLISVARGHGTVASQAVVQKNGQWITLKLDPGATPPNGTQSPILTNNSFPVPGGISSPPSNMPVGVPPQPSDLQNQSGMVPMPPTRFRHRVLRLPPYPGQNPTPPPQP